VLQEELVRLWVHENKRVFEDRLINAEDHEWFTNLMRKQLEKYFAMDWKDVVPNERLIYGDYMIPGADPRVRKQNLINN
jgi:dynein heavy chain, axonemal